MPLDVSPVGLLTAPGEIFELVRGDGGGLVYRNAPHSLRQVLIDAGARASSADYIVYEDRRISSVEHDARSRQLAAHLHHELGVRHGDRVAIAMRNLPEFSIAFWALLSIGAVAVPLNAWWSGPELAASIRHSGSTVLIVDDERRRRLQTELPTLGLRTVLATGADATSGTAEEAPEIAGEVTDLSTVFATPAPDTYPDAEVGPDDIATIVYTSGTTGSPKGAVHLHRNYCSSLMHNLVHAEAARRERQANGASKHGPQDAILLTYPLFHIAGLINLCLSMGALGDRTKLVLMRRWDPVQATDLIIDEQVTRALLVPTTLRALLAEGGTRLAATPGLALHFAAAGGASVPAELIDRLAELFDGRVQPGNGYGLTETTAGVIAGAGVEYINNPGSVGRPLPGMEVRIVDVVTGTDAPTGDVGEIVVRGPSVCAGYWNNPAETAKSFENGWFRTGDLGRVDIFGLYYVVDRIKEVIIRGGENVFCPEVEAAIEQHPDVLEAAVFGVPDDRYGELVAAVVRTKPDADLDAEHLLDYLADRLAYFKVPAYIVLSGGDLPRTASGKVLKRELRPLIS